MRRRYGREAQGRLKTIGWSVSVLLLESPSKDRGRARPLGGRLVGWWCPAGRGAAWSKGFAIGKAGAGHQIPSEFP